MDAVFNDDYDCDGGDETLYIYSLLKHTHTHRHRNSNENIFVLSYLAIFLYIYFCFVVLNLRASFILVSNLITSSLWKFIHEQNETQQQQQ